LGFDAKIASTSSAVGHSRNFIALAQASDTDIRTVGRL
jgi:hypothetical protein